MLSSMEPNQRPPAWIAAAPNVLSSLRLGLAAAFPILPGEWRLVAVIAGALTDWLDGFIARRFHAKSVSGGLLDAIADKLFVLSVLLTLAAAGFIAWWVVPLLIARDLTVGYVALHTALRGDWDKFAEMRPRIGGKVTTVGQFALFATILAWGDPIAVIVVTALTVGMSILAAADYLGQFIRALRAAA